LYLSLWKSQQKKIGDLMVRLNQEQINAKKAFIHNYIHAENAADGSKLDANANVSSKNIATMSAEIHKDINIQVNRSLIMDYITKRFDEDLAQEYNRQLEAHEIYTHDETSLAPYCVSISMYPFLLDGLKGFGGDSEPPKHLASFCGTFVNLVFAISSQFAGAVATVEWLMYFDHFARRDYGDNYLETHTNEVANHLQHVVYALNQPAAARGFQSVFWNISIYDRPYFEAMFGSFIFPNGDKPQYGSLDTLQRFFMKWFNKEREKALLTFPVVTSAALTNGTTYVDQPYQEFIATEYSEGNAFFAFSSENAHALSSCCRLKNDISDDINDFSYSLGAGGVATGSMNVITININRLIQDGRNLSEQVEKIHKYQLAFKDLFDDYIEAGMLPVYSNNYITTDKQYLTIGVNGVLEAGEYLGYEIDNNTEYKNWTSDLLKEISDLNKINAAKYGVKFNTEFVPAENLGVKFAKWDRADGYVVPRACYNSYLYKVEDDNISILDKFTLHGKDTSQFLDGGSAYHCNLEGYGATESFKKLIDVSVQEGCEYFCFNILITLCRDCEHIDKQTRYRCEKCGSGNIDHATRVIGYLKKVSSFSSERQKESALRHYSVNTISTSSQPMVTNLAQAIAPSNVYEVY
jgi:ribonucleoside-triphosphate reductase